MSAKKGAGWVRLLLVFVFLVALASLGGLLLGDFYYTQERFPHNTFVENVNISLLTKKEAVKKLAQTPADEVFLTSFTLSSEAGAFRYKPSSLGIFVLPQESINRAFKLTHQKNYLKDLSERLSRPKTLAFAVAAVDKGRLRAALLDLAKEIAVSSREATVDFKESKKFVLVPEVIGRELNIEESLKQILAALKAGKKTLPIKIESLSPRITLEDLKEYPPVHRLSQYTTYYGSHDDPNRISNIKLIASLLDNYILLPGESFSLLSHIGDFSEKRGFKEALVIVGKELVPQYGGGSCQIATTLFNAVSLADLKIEKRRNHSIWFNIYPLGRDAMVYSTYSDFRFINNSPHPIMLKTKASNRYLTFKVLGTPTGKRVYFTRPKIEGTIGKEPFKTRVLKIVKEKGRIIKKEEILSSYRQAGDKDIPIRSPNGQ